MPASDLTAAASGKKPAGTPSAPLAPRWLGKIVRWFRVKRLEQQWRSSRKFQDECEKIRCFTLARLEAEHRAGIEVRLRQERERRL